MPKRYKHLFEQVVSLENLFAAARKAMRGKRGKAPAARCFADLEKVVVDLRDELVSGRWRPGEYFYFTITDPKSMRWRRLRFEIGSCTMRWCGCWSR
jgi:RNA-directed DNA polymerase